MNDAQREAFAEMTEILVKIQDMGETLRDLVRHNFPQEMPWCEAYGIFDLAGSGNPYDNTLEKLIENIDKQDADGDYEEEEEEE